MAAEVANAVAIGERRQRLAPADVMRFLELLRELPIEIDAQTAARALSHTLPLTERTGFPPTMQPIWN